jgi:hypothetical protein
MHIYLQLIKIVLKNRSNPRAIFNQFLMPLLDALPCALFCCYLFKSIRNTFPPTKALAAPITLILAEPVALRLAYVPYEGMVHLQGFLFLGNACIAAGRFIDSTHLYSVAQLLLKEGIVIATYLAE